MKIVIDIPEEDSVFKKWAIDNGYDEKAEYGECTIDRINPYGNYEPSNCRWISLSEQAYNKRADMREVQDESMDSK